MTHWRFSANVAFFYAKNSGFLYQNFSVIYDFLRDWSRPGLPCFLSLLMLSSQARGTSAKSSLFPSSHKGIFDESMAVWGPSLRSFPAIFTDHGHINKVIPISKCLQEMVGTSLWMTLTTSVSRFSTNILGKILDFWKIWNFQKILRFSENNFQLSFLVSQSVSDKVTYWAVLDS